MVSIMSLVFEQGNIPGLTRFSDIESGENLCLDERELLNQILHIEARTSTASG